MPRHRPSDLSVIREQILANVHFALPILHPGSDAIDQDFTIITTAARSGLDVAMVAYGPEHKVFAMGGPTPGYYGAMGSLLRATSRIIAGLKVDVDADRLETVQPTSPVAYIVPGLRLVADAERNGLGDVTYV